MKQFLFTLFISLGLTLGVSAKPYDHRDYRDNMQHLSQKKIKRMDRKHTGYKAVQRNFRTEKQFLHRTRHHVPRNVIKHSLYQNRYDYNRDGYRHRDNIATNRQRGFRNWKRGWVLSYRYDRASFYDNRGYHYGYFNRHGYYFEDVFYRYDRYYTYQDRVRGKGLFDHRYYMPSNSIYYGFQ